MNDSVLEEKFNKAFDKIKEKLSQDIQEEIDHAIQIIIDEKILMHQHQRAYNKIEKLEKLLNELKIKIPAELSYRKASYYLEFEYNPESAEEILIALINKQDVDDSIKDRCRFSLCKMYLKEISFNQDDPFIIRENLNKADVQYSYLQQRAYSRKLDNYIQGDLWNIKSSIDNINKNKQFKVLSFPGCIESSCNSREECLKGMSTTNIFIDFTTDEIFINQNKENFSPDDMKLIYLLAKGTNALEVQEKLKIKENAFYKKIQRLREELEKFGINTIKRKYKLDSSIKVKVLYKLDEMNTFYYDFISDRY